MVTIQQTGGLQALQRATWAFRRLTVYRPALDTPGFDGMKDVLDVLASPGTSTNRQMSPDLYHILVYKLSSMARVYHRPYHSDPWKELVMRAAIYTETAFSHAASLSKPGTGLEDLPRDLILAAQHDLTLLGDLYRLDCRWVQTAVAQTSPGMPRVQGMLPTWNDMMIPGEQPFGTKELMDKLAETLNWAECIDDLLLWHRSMGSGLPSRYPALKWNAGSLTPILEPDPVRINDLEGYARQRTIVVDNTRRFLEGLPGQNLLLYGERGTGKSSTIKALLQEFSPAGLRMVELDRWDLRELPDLFAYLGGRSGHFVIFIDDLSFEDSETQYKGLKSAMEGSLGVKPGNVLIYATSNRRHIVKELHTDREPSQEVHGGDGMQEKLSLADRFGISILYPAPDQAAYIEMVLAMALKAGVPMGEAELRSKALRWAANGNGRSPRSARQFINTCINPPKNV